MRVQLTAVAHCDRARAVKGKSNAAMERPMRFFVFKIEDGPWLVLDQARDRKTVASCSDSGAAETFAALMNGDFQYAMARRDEAIASLVLDAGPSLHGAC